MAYVGPALAALFEQPEDRRRVGAFVLVRPLGKGGFAPVWLAREVYGDTELRTVAVKLFSIDEGRQRTSPTGVTNIVRDQVLAEARALCQVEHPNIVRFFALAT